MRARLSIGLITALAALVAAGCAGSGALVTTGLPGRRASARHAERLEPRRVQRRQDQDGRGRNLVGRLHGGADARRVLEDVPLRGDLRRRAVLLRARQPHDGTDDCQYATSSSLSASESYLDAQSKAGTIDPESNLNGQKAYLWSGTWTTPSSRRR